MSRERAVCAVWAGSQNVPELYLPRVCARDARPDPRALEHAVPLEPAVRPFSAPYRHPAHGCPPAASQRLTAAHRPPAAPAAPTRNAVRPYNAPEFREWVPVPESSLRLSETILCPPRGNSGLGGGWVVGRGSRRNPKNRHAANPAAPPTRKVEPKPEKS